MQKHSKILFIVYMGFKPTRLKELEGGMNKNVFLDLTKSLQEWQRGYGDKPVLGELTGRVQDGER